MRSYAEPAQGGFGVDLVLPTSDRQGGIGDGNGEVLAGLVLADHLADLDAGRPGADEFVGLDVGEDGREQLFGGGQQDGSSRGRPSGQCVPSIHELDGSNNAIRAGLASGPR